VLHHVIGLRVRLVARPLRFVHERQPLEGVDLGIPREHRVREETELGAGHRMVRCFHEALEGVEVLERERQALRHLRLEALRLLREREVNGRARAREHVGPGPERERDEDGGDQEVGRAQRRPPEEERGPHAPEGEPAALDRSAGGGPSAADHGAGSLVRDRGPP
jgi:hypothetical protein